MKFYAAALLAIGAAALSLKEQGPADEGDLPYPAPTCPEPPAEDVSDEEIWMMIDKDGSMSIDAQEGFNALYCMVEWGELTVDEAMFLFDYLGKHADLDEEGTPEELDPSEAMIAFETLEAFDEMGGIPECGE